MPELNDLRERVNDLRLQAEVNRTLAEARQQAAAERQDERRRVTAAESLTRWSGQRDAYAKVLALLDAAEGT